MTTDEREPEVWREGYLAAGDTRFFVRARGHGDDVALLLHGWPEDGSSWRHVAPALVDAGYRVVAPDLKGFGRSDGPRRGYDPETLADEVAQLIRGLHVRKAVLVGHDWGGAIALATAFRHPGLVRALVVAAAPFRQLDLRASWHIPLLNLPVVPEVAFRLAARPLVAATLRHAARVHTPFDDEVVDAYAAAISATPSAWLRYYRTLSRRAVVDLAVRRVRSRVGFLADPEGPHRLRVPTTVVWGEDDPATPFHLAPRVAHDLGAQLVALPGVGHFVHEEDPEGVVRAILGLAGPGGGARVPLPERTRP
ncbi:alpha/beta hydrolase [Nitriliruptoraceae bacterium ZYF776]|nr:alpha/beta hydrolase [Profundirhabdus halotolerans]